MASHFIRHVPDSIIRLMSNVWHLTNLLGHRQLRLAQLFPLELHHDFYDLAPAV